MIKGKQTLCAHNAMVHSNIARVPIGSRKWSFSAHLLSYVELERCQFLTESVSTPLKTYFYPFIESLLAIER